MSSPSYARHRFPPSIIQHAVWLNFRFALSYRDVEDLLAERGIDASYESIRRWALKFGRAFGGDGHNPPIAGILTRLSQSNSLETGGEFQREVQHR